MRFKGKPNMHVIDAKKDVEIGMFNSKGYLEIKDEELIERMKKRFKPAPIKQKKAAKSASKDVK